MKLLMVLLAFAAASSADEPDAVFVEIAPGVVVRLDSLPIRDEADMTPLHHVARTTGDAALVRALIARGADPDARDLKGRTPLHEAAASAAPPSVVAALIEGGADPAARDVEGFTPLHLTGDPTLAGLLISAGGEPCAVAVSGETALSAALLERIRTEKPDAYPTAVEAFLTCL